MGYTVSENDAPVEDVFNGSMNAFGGDVSEPVVLGQPAHSVAGQTQLLVVLLLDRAAGGRGVCYAGSTSRWWWWRWCCALCHSALALRRVQTVLTILLLRFIHARITPFALIVSMSSCMRNIHRIHRHIIYTVQLHVPCMVWHDARGVQNSSNSLGDGVVRGRGICVPGETKSPSMSTRSGVRRSAVCGSTPTQQTPLKLHAETWEGLLCNQGPKIFREVEIVPGCAVKVACPSLS